MATKPLTVAHEIEPWGRACPGMLLSRGGLRATTQQHLPGGAGQAHAKGRYRLSPKGTLCPPTKWVDGWTARTLMPSLCWIVLPSRAQASAAIERDFVAPAGARWLSWSQESKTQTGLASTLRTTIADPDHSTIDFHRKSGRFRFTNI